MKKRCMVVTVLAMLILLNQTSNSQLMKPKSLVELVTTGAFHGSEVTAKTGETWLGLYVDGDQSLLLSYRLTVETVFDEIMDYGTTNKTGKEITVDLPLEPLFLVKQAHMLSTGPVSTIFGHDETHAKPLLPGSPVELRLSGDIYSLEVIGTEDAKCQDQQLPHNARLILKSYDRTQTLYSLGWDCPDDAGWGLLWAGDLDRDGKLDLYVVVNQHYNVEERRLFLSSQAGKGQLVKEVAQFVTSGC